MVAPSHLRSFQALELALRLGSLKAAAEALGITPAAVGQRIKVLEEFVGIELLTRGRNGLAPSPALAPVMPALGRAFRDLQLAADTLDMQRGHEIHIAATLDFAERWLHPRLGAFRAGQPNVAFCVNGEGDAPHRLGSADCEIRFGPLQAGSEILFRDFVVPVCSPENERRISVLPRRDRLEGFPLLHVDTYKEDPAIGGWAEWIRENRFRRTAPERGIRFQRVSAALEAVLADAGLALCGLALVLDALLEQRIATPFGVSGGRWTTFAYVARFRPDALARPQVRRFRDWLLAESAASGDQLEAVIANGR